MRVSLAAAPFLFLSVGESFVARPRTEGRSWMALKSTLEEQQQTTTTQHQIQSTQVIQETDLVALTAEEINSRLAAQLDKLRAVDQTSSVLTKGDIQSVYDDENIMVVNKPSGVLTVGGKEKHPNLAQVIFDISDTDLPTPDHMVVHRLGMNTSGLIIFAKNKPAVRALNTALRTRKVERQYEALVVGHIQKDEGLISLPIMRDYEFPPYVRISTYDHQCALVDLTPEEVGTNILEGPKASITKYEVISREDFQGQGPVTRVLLTSVSGRYHQLNVHMAAFGHPIVGDNVYGYNGEAVSNGGLTDDELDTLIPNPHRADATLQATLAEASKDTPPCVHAKRLKFRYLDTSDNLELTSEAPF